MLTSQEMRALELDPNMVDAALMTTRGVRRRLDLEREVPDQILLDCINVAEQAPTGGNEGSRRWVIVKQQAVKDQIAEIYLRAGADWVIERATAIEGTDHPNANMMQGAKYLAQNIANVPALVIPTILGVHDGSGRPGLFDSIIQSGWSFQVALRARGLGSVWTTMILGETDALREILGIPADVTPVALFPVAYTVGTEFSPSPRRYPANQITYWDRYARTLDDERQPGAMVEVDIKASPRLVWDLVTDRDTPNRFAEQDLWPGPAEIITSEPHTRFQWRTSDSTEWEFRIERIPGGSRLRFSCIFDLGDPAGQSASSIEARQDEYRPHMQQVVDGIKGLAEEASGR